MTRLPALIALALLAACSADPQATNNSAAVAQAPAALLPLVIQSSKGAQRFTVEVAATPQQQEAGLMFRKSLADNGGMLFPMDPPRTASFWMKNTLIPLDMLFIRTDGTIAFIGANTVPYSREPVSAGVPVAAVLELRGGRAAQLGIREGDVVQWGPCTQAAPRKQGTVGGSDFCPPAL